MWGAFWGHGVSPIFLGVTLTVKSGQDLREIKTPTRQLTDMVFDRTL